ncbi:MAG TPA: hypothetical protein VIL37_05400 [Natronosporangium sp.]
MNRLRESRPVRRARQETATAWQRANNAALALRGRTPPANNRKWLGTGLAIGTAIGAAGAAVLRRNRDGEATGRDPR